MTRVVSESFAGLADREASVEMEIRASWTPVGGDVADHLRAWADMLCTIAGIPPAARRRRPPAGAAPVTAEPNEPTDDLDDAGRRSHPTPSRSSSP